MTALVPAVAPAQASDEVVLNWALWDWANTTYYKPLIEAYEAQHPNVKIEHTDLASATYQTMVMTQMTGGGSDIDIVAIKDVPGYANMVSAGALMDLNGSIDAAGINASDYSGLLDALIVDGTAYALPFRSDNWITYYNKDIFDAAGVDYPTNNMDLVQFEEMARAITTGFGANKSYGALLHTWASPVQQPCAIDGEHTLLSGSYEFLAPCYEMALRLQEDGIMPSYASMKTSQTHYSGPFYNGVIGLMPMGSWFISSQIAKVKSGESLTTNWGIAAFPHAEGIAEGSAPATVTGIGVSANSPHQEAAFDFIKFVAGPEGAAIIADTGTIPALKTEEVMAKITGLDGFPQDETSLNALKATATYLEMPVDLKGADINVVIGREHDAIMTGTTSVEDGLAAMGEDIQAILAEE